MDSGETFQSRRARGIVWVCDVVGSSNHLNDNETAAAIEAFLPRLEWLGMVVVRAAGGVFIKSTGDGFLAWFETPLYREMPEMVPTILMAAWQVSTLVNVTGLGIPAKKKIKLNHAVTYEQDALLRTLKHLSGFESIDVTGRSVTLAFRLCSVPAPHPGVLTQREIAKAGGLIPMRFTPWRPNEEQRLRYFKGESWGVTDLYIAANKTTRKRTPSSILKHVVETMEYVKGRDEPHPQLDFARRFYRELASGPLWSRLVVSDYCRFIKEDLLGSLEALVEVAKESPEIMAN